MVEAGKKAEWRLGTTILWRRARWNNKQLFKERNNEHKEEKREKNERKRGQKNEENEESGGGWRSYLHSGGGREEPQRVQSISLYNESEVVENNGIPLQRDIL